MIDWYEDTFEKRPRTANLRVLYQEAHRKLDEALGAYALGAKMPFHFDLYFSETVTETQVKITIQLEQT